MCWHHEYREGKLAELGYDRSSKKCKEKFENVHKYYKRTKEGRGGRQDGKSYKFFTQLEALNRNTATTTGDLPYAVSFPPPDQTEPAVPLFGNFGVSFSSDSSSSSEGEGDEEKDKEEMETESTENRNQRKRKRSSDSDERMMDFVEGLLRQVLQKQEAMQHKFLEAIEKREQDRMIREEAWKRQDMARIGREHELMAHERSISASRDAAVISFLEKITGQTINLPTAIPQNHSPPPPPPPHPDRQNQQSQTQNYESSQPLQPPYDIVAALPEQHITSQHDLTLGSSMQTSSSRWPKAEVLALIEVRSGLETKYQEAGPKGPLWEEVSAAMQGRGYSRSAKRCKEKWENINKYYKKVKESNKKRAEDAKTCPYFHELDALYRKKVLGSSSVEIHSLQIGSNSSTEVQASIPLGEPSQGDIGGKNQPEDTVVRMQSQQAHGYIMDNSSDSVDCSNVDDMNQEGNEDNYEEVEENEDEYDNKTDAIKMAYKIYFKRSHVVGII